MTGRMRRKREICLLSGILLAVVLMTAGVYSAGRMLPREYYDAMCAAAERFRDAAQAVKEERLRRGIPVSSEDVLSIGLLGIDYSDITTTQGQLPAKRTAQTPDMAALCVRLLSEAGLKGGDCIGACFSGSFPGLDLALLTAADVLGIQVIYTVSVGASTYGANVPEYTAPEMILTAYDAGLISTLPASVSVGGTKDRGENMFGMIRGDDTVIRRTVDRVEEAVTARGIPFAEHSELPEDVAYHMALYGDIDGFVNVGGAIVGEGENYAVLDMGQGVIRDPDIPINENSGLLEQYLSRSLPTIQLLNVRQLCLEYGIAFDPAAIPEIGLQGVYYEKVYPKMPILLAGTAGIGMLAIYAAYTKKKGHAPHD